MATRKNTTRKRGGYLSKSDKSRPVKTPTKSANKKLSRKVRSTTNTKTGTRTHPM